MSLKLALFNISDYVRRSRFPSLGLGYIASYLRKCSDFKETYIIEGNGEAKIKKIKPDIIGIYSATQTFREAVSMAELIKAEYKDIPIIVGGYHISALPRTLPMCFDIGVLGEGEETTRELMEVIAKYGIKPEKLSRVKGIVFHNDDKVVITPRRDFIKDMDSIPFPARDLLANTKFSSIITSRGCPYKCVFCASVRFWANPRVHSAEYVVDEIQEIINKYKAVHISIWDDLFIAYKSRLETICDLIHKRGINKKVSFGCALRSNLVNPDICSLLKRINVRRISLGIESGSQKILDFLKGGSVTVEQHIKTVELCKSYGFYTTGTFMIGSPGEDREDLRKTLELIKKLKLDGGGSVSITAPLPGTELWDYARQKKMIIDELDSARIGIMATDFSAPQEFKGILLTNRISKEDFFQMAQKIQKEADKYYVKGFFRRENFTLRNLQFFLTRPREVIAIFKFILKFLLRKSSVMDRYVYYYKKLDI